MTERDPHCWARFTASVGALIVLVVVAPIGLIAASRSRFRSANPLAGADPPWTWGADDVGGTLSGPLADDTVVDGIIRLSLCAVWGALVVVAVTTLVEVVHVLRHHGIGLPEVRGIGWAQSLARFIAIGLIAVIPSVRPSTSLASTLGARDTASSPIEAPPVAPLPTPSASPSEAGSSPTTPMEESGTVHVVTAGESVYSIAVDLANGDSSRILEIADAIIDENLGSSMPGGQRFTNPAYIEVGWTLQLPVGVPHGHRTGNASAIPAEPTDSERDHVHGRTRRHALGHRRRAARRSDRMDGDLGPQRRRRHGRRADVRRSEPDPARMGTRTRRGARDDGPCGDGTLCRASRCCTGTRRNGAGG